MKRLALACCLLLTGCGLAKDVTLRDLRHAQARAEIAGDEAAAACMRALVWHVEQQQFELERPAGLMDAAIAARIAYRKTQGGIPSRIRADCDAVAIDLLIFMGRLGIKFVPGL